LDCSKHFPALQLTNFFTENNSLSTFSFAIWEATRQKDTCGSW